MANLDAMPRASGAVATSAAPASRLGARVLEAGGNAVDAAVGAALALTVADPANVSLLGRCHALVVGPGGGALAVDGATEAPRRVGAPGPTPLSGHAAAPLPGIIPALHTLWRLRGRLAWRDIVRPVAELAADGFEVAANQARTWNDSVAKLTRDPVAARLYLKPDGSPYRAGDRFRNPVQADFLQALAEQGPDLLFGSVAESLEAESRAGGGFLTAGEIRQYRALPGETVRLPYAGYELVTVGRQAWGYTLALMLGILDAWKRTAGWGGPIPDAVMALALHRALAEQPQEIGTLKPRPGGRSHESMLEPALHEAAAARIVALLSGPRETLAAHVGAPEPEPEVGEKRGDTTHLSAMDGDGLAVALTASIGPSFGAAVASASTGSLFAHSYRMASDPTPGARDRTEMSPAILLHDGRPVLAAGGADNERIPGATAQVICNVVDSGMELQQAVAAPRVNWGAGLLRTSAWMPAERRTRLAEAGFALAPAEGVTARTGVVQAVGVAPADGRLVGAADPSYDGTAVVQARTTPRLA
ncbi:gamma-glutamyltranspeptidase [Thalassobaculum fulvum]|uniref:Gamma-glutamyltranspeptidase n=1 Tax=Thalassobaculum fulvum TaxID=1633335 RepID=A0A918XRR1_9PROT|nr:gamma-glutamyltransferase [Thalassobaculum fulvum]GHD50686.1 gamma-glutamyltranspeptidase [Thalassobaculum fulvum]